MITKIKLAKKKILPIRLVITPSFRRIKISDYKDRDGGEKNFKLNFNFLLDYIPDRRKIRLSDGLTIGISYIDRYDEWNPGFFGSLVKENYFPLVDHLLRLFCCSEVYMFIELSEISEDLLAHPTLQKCSNIRIVGTADDTSLTDNVLLTVLKHTMPSHGLLLDCLMTDGLRQKQIFELPFLYISDARWIEIDYLISMKCEILFLEDHKLEVADMNKFLRHWVAGGIQNIRRLRIKKLTDMSWDDFFGDLSYEKWDGKRRGRYFKTHSTHSVWTKDCKDGWDFVGSGGKLGTVLQSSEYFDFLVWHDRNNTFVDWCE